MARDNDFNQDPISKEPGAHPVGTGLGAIAGGAATGAVAGTFAGPAGAVVGGVAGAVVGGMGGKAVAETINPTVEEAYWKNSYNRESYYEAGRSFDDYAPAYRLGLSGYTQHGGDFEEKEAHLARDWDAKKERSTLAWPQAREASRAAWDRLDMNYGQSQSQSSSIQIDDDAIDTLNDLLETCRDGEYGFRECAEHTTSENIRVVMDRRAEDCHAAAMELEALIKQMGGTADEGGSVSGAMHRGWVSVKGTLSGYNDKAMLDECERGEDVALARYRKALKQNDLPAMAQTLVERQAQGVQRNHDQIKALRNAVKQSS